MPVINFTNPFTIVVALVLFLLMLYLGKETKKAWIIGILLFLFLGVLVGHTIEFSTIADLTETVYNEIISSTIFDLIFIFLCFISYLWVDDIEVKAGKKKSIDNSLDWFWNKV